MNYIPKNLKRWEMPKDYFGASWPEYYSSGFGRSRDSDDLEASNFATALKALGGESETVLVVRESHWAVGWVEWIAIHESDPGALEIADGLCADYNNYPVLDEEDFSRREHEHAEYVWRDCMNNRERIAYMKRHASQFDFRNFQDMLGCARGHYFAGYASELLA